MSSRRPLGPVALLQIASFVVVPIALSVACGSSAARSSFGDDAAVDSSGAFGEGGGGLGEGGIMTGIGGRDPVSCDEAATFKTYVGCDYWPTVTDNVVADIFDFAVAVANGGSDSANVTVTGPGGVNKQVTVPGGSISKVYLPWVRALKSVGMGGTADNALKSSVLATKSAYHLVSDKPVVVYQFSPLEFEAKGGDTGKDWTSCVPLGSGPACYSYSNDASLLLPSTAMTGNYRIMGITGWSESVAPGFPGQAISPSYFVVTGTANGTKVTVKLSSTGAVVGGSGITTTPANGTLTFNLDAGDVAEVIGTNGSDGDFSGSLLTADHPVQVITGISCINLPSGAPACDHVEETVFPAETLGKHYVVMRPAGPKNNDVGQIVRFFGNVDGTTLTYKPSQPSTCPAFLNAGQVADCGVVSADFEVSADKEFGVATFLLAGSLVDPDMSAPQPQGDPSQSFAVTVEQYRTSYVFLAPNDYKTSFVDIIAPPNATITLDGQSVGSQLNPISGTGFIGGHVSLGAGKDGVHSLQSTDPIGIQVIGYGDNTSYQYPGGLNLSAISAVPVK
ncbi:MAG: hemagglutinin/hemolysin-related protein [Myxococcaceae bacterium]|nr:hemagglutinin/hemolysin-related protein [Myxococcaceae bacterium]MEA2749763.1 hypothetical protein [Myxococcales bacterium]